MAPLSLWRCRRLRAHSEGNPFEEADDMNASCESTVCATLAPFFKAAENGRSLYNTPLRTCNLVSLHEMMSQSTLWLCFVLYLANASQF